jgi:hypothetical protein
VKTSIFFQHFWNDTSIGSHINPTSDTLLDKWIAYVELYLESWRKFVLLLEKGITDE